jgi:hypothetical protein
VEFHGSGSEGVEETKGEQMEPEQQIECEACCNAPATEPKIDINKIGEQVAALIQKAEKDKAKIAPMLCHVWTALEAKQEVNGCKSKGAWAEKFGITLRYCQYIVKGKRDRSVEVKKRDANHVVRLTDGQIVSINGAKYKVVASESNAILVRVDDAPVAKAALKLNTEPQRVKVLEGRILQLHVGSKYEVRGGGINSKLRPTYTYVGCMLEGDPINQFAAKDKPVYHFTDENGKEKYVVKTSRIVFYAQTEHAKEIAEIVNAKLGITAPAAEPKKDIRKAHLPYSPDYGTTYTTYCGKPLRGLKVIGRDEENTKKYRMCAKCFQLKFGDNPKRPFTDLSDAEVAALMSDPHPTPEPKELRVKLTKAQAGQAFHEIEMLVEDEENYPEGVDEKEWLDAQPTCEGRTTLVFDTTKPLFRLFVDTLLRELDDWASHKRDMVEVSTRDLAQKNRDREVADAAQNAAGKIRLALRSVDIREENEKAQVTLVTTDNCPTEEVL